MNLLCGCLALGLAEPIAPNILADQWLWQFPTLRRGYRIQWRVRSVYFYLAQNEVRSRRTVNNTSTIGTKP
jgi:hypothetical protein